MGASGHYYRVGYAAPPASRVELEKADHREHRESIEVTEEAHLEKAARKDERM
jgi:hypothetical protein